MKQKTNRISDIFLLSPEGKKISAQGWVRSVRDSKQVAFIELNDGSCFKSLQIVVEKSVIPALPEGLSTGAAIKAVGTLEQSPGGKQAMELKATEIELIGASPEDYPLQKKRHSFEFLRQIAHLRPRTNTFGAVMRVRNTLSQTIHRFFSERGFMYVHSPIITTSDAEGAGAMFRVSAEAEGMENNEFFGKPAYLTVSGQLEAEIYAQAFGRVYTFGPTFRAENSNTTRHLSEFWMVEPEMAFCELEDDMQLAEDFIKALLNSVLKENAEDMEFFDRWISQGIIKQLTGVAEASFEHISYTEAIEKLKKSGKKFEYEPHWGMDIQTEHERYLAEELVGGPVIVTDYPRDIKAFYMKQNPDNKTVRAMDVLVPRLGEIIGGSQREDDYDKLLARIKELGMNPDNYWWYLELRKYGSTPHSGFGLGFDRMVQYVTGMQNIRDVIPFPRTPGNAEF